ncbi:MAG: response regulator [Oscillospiraceae bacterium]|nr:response regulator [Oscillospiraceae bacterium]
MKKFFESYSLLFFFVTTSVTVLGVSLYSRSLVNFFVETSDYNIRQRLCETAKRLSAQITAEELDAFRTAADMERPEYQALRLRLVEFAKDADVLYVYFLREENGKLQYIVDNDFDEKTRVGLDTPPEPRERVPNNLPALEGKVGVSPLGVYNPGWDGLLTSYAPVYDREGKVAAILGVDLNDEMVVGSRLRVRVLGMLEITAVILVFASGIFGFRRYRREAHAAKDANNAKSHFLSRMSHEIRTPMNAVIGMSDLAAREYGTPQGREYIADIQQAGTNLLAVINDILDFSKIESGKLNIRNEAYEAASLFVDVLTIIRIRLGAKDVRFISDIAPDIPATITGDVARVREILINLLSNAVKYTEQGFITFTARCRRDAAAGLRPERHQGAGGDAGPPVVSKAGDSITLIFKVTDSGIGIRREAMSSLFTDFSRVGDTRSGMIEGTGLGLSITRQLCRAMGGDVTAESEHGVGSTFTATIRQSAAADSAPMGALGGKMALRAESASIAFIAPDFRVLVVDDNAANLKVVTGLLLPYEMQVDACRSGAEALSLVQKNEYDLVFMDHMMLGMDGVETLAALRDLGGRCETLPVVAFTANAMSGMKEFFLKKGFDDYLSKPIELPKLNELIESRVPAAKRQRVPGEGRAKAVSASPSDMAAANKGEQAAQQLDLLGHFRWHFANDELPVDQDYCEKLSALVEAMETPPHLAADMARLAAAGRRGDREEIARLLPDVYEAIAAVQEGREAGESSGIFDDTLKRLKTALDAGDSPGVNAAMNALRAMDALSAEERELYFFLNDAHLMDETEKASAKLNEWMRERLS